MDLLSAALLVAAALAVGAAGSLVTEAVGAKRRGEESIGYVETFLTGTAQAAALMPGVSRSGATLLLALRRDGAARFVFLLSLPAVAAVAVAAAVKEALDVSEVGMTGVPVALLLVGLVTSAVVGYLTLRLFLRYLTNHPLAVFAYYRFAVAAATVVWLTVRGGS